jgi:hypothetical protein
MNAVRIRLGQRIACLGALAALALASAGCTVGAYDDYPGEYPPGADDYPPDAYIATTEPVYFDGHASYFYGGRWFYRDGGRWSSYQHEPAELARHRAAGPPVRHSYEHYQGHAAAHVSVRASGGHGHR